MKNQDKIVDWRSTGRRIGRRELYKARVPYKCVGYRLEDGSRFKCGKTSKEPPKDAPHWFNDIWPSHNRVLDSQLQVDHETKNVRNNDIEDLNWKCPSCHRLDDQQTEKGVAQVSKNLWVEPDYRVEIDEELWA
jgi:hypothetical protein